MSDYLPFAIGHWPERGQAALSLVFLIGGIVLAIGISLAFVVLSFINSSYGFQAANRALAAATTGAEDALLKLVRDKDFSAASPYTISVGGQTASVTVTQNSPATGQAKILAWATVSRYQRKIQVIAAVASSTGLVNVVSWEQVNL